MSNSQQPIRLQIETNPYEDGKCQIVGSTALGDQIEKNTIVTQKLMGKEYMCKY